MSIPISISISISITNLLPVAEFIGGEEHLSPLPLARTSRHKLGQRPCKRTNSISPLRSLSTTSVAAFSIRFLSFLMTRALSLKNTWSTSSS